MGCATKNVKVITIALPPTPHRLACRLPLCDPPDSFLLHHRLPHHSRKTTSCIVTSSASCARLLSLHPPHIRLQVPDHRSPPAPSYLCSVLDLGRSAAPSSASQSSSSIPRPIPGLVKPIVIASSAATFYNTEDICQSSKPRSLDHSKVAKIRTWPSCESIINVRTFLGTAGPGWHHAQLDQGLFIHR
jgi:hypothetical protein